MFSYLTDAVGAVSSAVSAVSEAAASYVPGAGARVHDEETEAARAR